MTHGNDVYRCTGIIHRVHHTVITRANTPEVPPAFEFLATCWPRLTGQRLDFQENAFHHLARKFFQFLASGTAEGNGVLSHGVSPNESVVASRSPRIRAAHERAGEPAGHRRSPPRHPHVSSGQ